MLLYEFIYGLMVAIVALKKIPSLAKAGSVFTAKPSYTRMNSQREHHIKQFFSVKKKMRSQHFFFKKVQLYLIIFSCRHLSGESESCYLKHRSRKFLKIILHA